MSLFLTIATGIIVAAILVLSHALAWVRGFDSGKHSAAMDALNERVRAMMKSDK